MGSGVYAVNSKGERTGEKRSSSKSSKSSKRTITVDFRRDSEGKIFDANLSKNKGRTGTPIRYEGKGGSSKTITQTSSQTMTTQSGSGSTRTPETLEPTSRPLASSASTASRVVSVDGRPVLLASPGFAEKVRQAKAEEAIRTKFSPTPQQAMAIQGAINYYNLRNLSIYKNELEKYEAELKVYEEQQKQNFVPPPSVQPTEKSTDVFDKAQEKIKAASLKELTKKQRGETDPFLSSGKQAVYAAGATAVRFADFVGDSIKNVGQKGIVRTNVEAVAGLSAGAYTVGSKIYSGEGFPELGRTIRERPVYALATVGSELAAGYGIGEVVRVSASAAKNVLQSEQFSIPVGKRSTVDVGAGKRTTVVEYQGKAPVGTILKTDTLAAVQKPIAPYTRRSPVKVIDVKTFGIGYKSRGTPLVTVIKRPGGKQVVQFGRPIVEQPVYPYQLAADVPPPLTATGGQVFQEVIAMTPFQRSRLQSIITAARKGGKEGLIGTQKFYANIPGLNDPIRASAILEEEVARAGGTFFGSTTTRQLAVDSQTVRVGDADIVLPKGSPVSGEQLTSRVVGRWQGIGEDVRISPTDAKGLTIEKIPGKGMVQGEKLVEVKEGGSIPLPGEEVSATGFLGFKFPDLRGGVLKTTVPAGQAQQITIGEQFLRKAAASSIVTPGGSAFSGTAFEGAFGLLGKPRRTVKDIGGFVQTGTGISDLQRNSLFNFRQRSGAKLSGALDDYKSTFTPEQQGAIKTWVDDNTVKVSYTPSPRLPGSSSRSPFIPGRSPTISTTSPTVSVSSPSAGTFSSPSITPVTPPQISLSPIISPSPSPIPSPRPPSPIPPSPSPIPSPRRGGSPSPRPPSPPPPSPIPPSPIISPSPSPIPPSPSPTFSPSPRPPSPIPSPSPRPPYAPTPRTTAPFRFRRKEQDNQGLFGVQVRRRGEFKTIGTAKTYDQAFNLGKRAVGRTAAASFKIVSRSTTKKKKKKLPFGFYQSKKEPGVFIEQRSRRISTSGELREITRKGIQASKQKKMRF